MAMTTKVCSRCGEEKALEEFRPHKGCRLGVRPECRECLSKVSKKYYEDNKDRILRKQRTYNEKNAERINRRNKEYREANSDELNARRRGTYYANHEERKAALRESYQNNREARLVGQKRYRETNKEQLKERRRLDRLANPEKYKRWKSADYRRRRDEYIANAAKWARENPEKALASAKIKQHKRRAKKVEVGGSFTHQEFVRLNKHYAGRCLKCGKKTKLTADHVQALFNGGNNYISNIQPLCINCNSSKGARDTDYRLTGWGLAFPEKLLMA